MEKKNSAVSCDDCMYLDYDEDMEEYYCSQSCLDEDDVARMAENPNYRCPFYRRGNEYTIVKHQM